MRRINDLLFRLRTLVGLARSDRELDEEMRFHVDMQTQKLIDQGMTEAEAEREAVRRFGSMGRQKDRARESWGVTRLRDLGGDLKFVFRQLRRNPGFASAAILTLAIGIGANTAIFSIADRTLLRRPAVTDPDRLVAIYTTCRRGFPRCSSSYPDYIDYRDRSRTLDDLAAYSFVTLNLGDDDTAGRLASGLLVTGNYFDLLGIRPHIGRPIYESDNLEEAPAQVALVSFSLWNQGFGGSPEVLGSTIRLNGEPYTVVGVAPEGFGGLNLGIQTDVWIPILSATALGSAAGGAAGDSVRYQRSTRWIRTLVGRLAPGATTAQTRSEMDAIAIALGEEYPEDRAALGGQRGIIVDPLSGYILPPGNESDLKRFVWMLSGVVAFGLLLAAANLANLLLARATARGREIGVRLAIGAGRGRLARQLLTESSVLAVAGCAAGLLVAKGALLLLGAYELPGAVAIGNLHVGLNTSVLAFALSLSAVTAIVFGLVPALRATRLDLVTSLKGQWSLGGGSQRRLRKILVTLQVALSLVLLVGSGLFIRTLRNSMDTPLGFRAENAAAVQFNLALLRYGQEESGAFVDELVGRVRALPGVTAAGVSTLVPFQDRGFLGAFAEVEGYEPAPDEEIRVDYVFVGSDFFEALGTRILEGRPIDERDSEGTRPVLVINRHMAERFWPGRSAVGRSVRLSFSDLNFEVVGVAENPVWALVGEETTPFVFLPLDQNPDVSTYYLTLVARTDMRPETLLPPIRREIQALDSELSPIWARPLDELVGRALLPQRMGMTLLTMFGALALVLAAIGIYGVVSYSVRRQSREIGIRIAVGATDRAIVRGVLRDMATPVVAGLVFGGVAALVLSRIFEGFMFGVRPSDPITFVATGALLVSVALVAALIPARWAARLDPTKVLRVE